MTNSWRIVARDRRDILGEGPFWSPDRDALFWVDILGQRLNRLSLASGAVDGWDMPDAIGWAIERVGRSDLIAGVGGALVEIALDHFTIKPLATLDIERPYNRVNDAKADAAGRLWAGSKPRSGEQATGALYRIDADLGIQRVDDGYGVANGPAISPCGRWLYHTDSAARTVYRFSLADDGSLGPRTLFISFPDAWGYPDGMTVDAAGGLWIAHWEGGCVSRFTPDGVRDRVIDLPASRITSCAFAGHLLDRLFVTSAQMKDESDPLGGALFEVDPDCRGIAPYRFAG